MRASDVSTLTPTPTRCNGHFLPFYSGSSHIELRVPGMCESCDDLGVSLAEAAAKWCASISEGDGEGALEELREALEADVFRTLAEAHLRHISPEQWAAMAQNDFEKCLLTCMRHTPAGRQCQGVWNTEVGSHERFRCAPDDIHRMRKAFGIPEYCLLGYGHRIGGDTALCVAIEHLVHGSTKAEQSFTYGLCETTISEARTAVYAHIAKGFNNIIHGDYIAYATKTGLLRRICNQMYAYECNLESEGVLALHPFVDSDGTRPRVVGAMDGKQFQVSAPSHESERYVDRHKSRNPLFGFKKHNYAVNVNMVSRVTVCVMCLHLIVVLCSLCTCI